MLRKSKLSLEYLLRGARKIIATVGLGAVLAYSRKAFTYNQILILREIEYDIKQSSLPILK